MVDVAFKILSNEAGSIRVLIPLGKGKTTMLPAH
jgi:hypothetical protein